MSPATATVTIPIAATQDSSGTWTITDPGDTTVDGGTQVNFQLQNGEFFLVAVPRNEDTIFENGANQWFYGNQNNPTSGDKTVNPHSQLQACYHIFWSNGTAKASLDPRVIVNPVQLGGNYSS